MNRTVIFEPLDDGDDEAEASESLSRAVYPLVKSEYAAATGPVFSIGRVDGNDLIMPDFAISKTHAIIEIKRDFFWLADCGSTNGTSLNGQPVGKKPVKMNDGDKISFARYEFKLSSPKSLYHWLNEN
jgi:pSer/pThr/pTyr-binding forkhead associated (FHA) protein